MPRYFFDVETADWQVRDAIGIDLPHARAIWPEIARLIHDCIHTAPLTDQGRIFDVTIRDEAGRVIERSTSTMPHMRAE